jgi:hypothetical protein
LRSTLAELLGNDFPTKASRGRHPLLWLLINQAAWTRLELIALAEDIKATRGRTGFEGFHLRLGAADRFSESRAILRFGAALMRVGYDVTAEVALAISGRTKQPDLAVHRREGELDFTIELKQLGTTVESQRALEVTHRIFLALAVTPSGATWGGVLRRLPSPPRLDQILASIEGAYRRLPTSGFETVEIDGIISLALATSERDARFTHFSQLHGSSAGSLLGPDLRGSESQRILSALKAKRHQCSGAVPSLVVIQAGSTSLTSKSLPNFVVDVKETLGTHSAIAGAIVFGNHLGAPTETSAAWGDAEYTCRTRSQVVVEHMLFVPNPFPACPLPEEDWSRLKQALVCRAIA